MRRNTIVSAAILAALVFIVSGCMTVISPGIKIDPQSFGKKKKYAVVTIVGTKKLAAQKGLLQMFKGDIPEQDTQSILNKLRPEVIKSFTRSKHLKIKPEKQVLGSNAYQKLKGEEPVQKVMFMKTELNTAKGYKFITDTETLTRLAVDLKVDGVIIVSMNFSVSSGVAGGAGVGVKRFKVLAGVSAVAYDREGKVVWKDAVHQSSGLADSQLAVVADVRNVDFKKLKPHAVKAAKEGLKVLIQRFDDSMEGKKVGSHVETVTP